MPLLVNGINGYVDISGVLSDPTKLSIAMWAIALAPLAGSEVLFGHRSESTRLIQLTLGPLSDQVTFQLRGSGGGIENIATTTINALIYNHYVATFDKPNNSHKLYVNGELKASSTRNFGSQTFTSTSQLIAATDASGGPAFFADVKVEEFVLSNGIFTQEDVNQLCNNRFIDARTKGIPSKIQPENSITYLPLDDGQPGSNANNNVAKDRSNNRTDGLVFGSGSLWQARENHRLKSKFLAPFFIKANTLLFGRGLNRGLNRGIPRGLN